MASYEDVLAAKRTLSHMVLGPRPNAPVMAMAAAAPLSVVGAAGFGNVHAVGVGPKITEGKPTGEIAVRFYVVSKLAPSALLRGTRLPSQINGIPTDVIESPRAFIAPLDPRAKCRPVVPGVSCGHRLITAGTLGAFWRSTQSGDDPSHLFALSNNHVFAMLNEAKLGDSILQPGPQDGGQADQDKVAELYRFETLNFLGQPNLIDAAIARVLDPSTASNDIPEIGAITGTSPPGQDQALVKFGRTTGKTAGTIFDTTVDTEVGMDHGDPSKVAVFHDQIRVNKTGSDPVALGGDSGSLFVTPQGLAVGLLFACPPSGEYALASPILKVMERLQINLLGDDHDDEDG